MFLLFFTYVKMPKDSSAKYYQNIKERYKLVKDTKVFLKKKKKKSNNYGREQYKNLIGGEKQKLMEYRKNIK